MLTINKTSASRGLEAVIAVASDMSDWDRARLARISTLFHGHHTEKPDAYIFTEARGKKCWELFTAGFDARKQYAKADRHCITHPDIPRVLRVAEALDLVGVVTPKAAKEEAWA